MEIIPKRKLPSGTKVKRLTLYPREKYSFEKSEVELPKKPEEKPGGQWRWIPTREKPEMKTPEKLPYYKELPPKYEVPAEPSADSRSGMPPWAKNFLIFVGVVIIPLALVLGVLIIKEIDWDRDGNGESVGGVRCPTTCNSTVGVTVDRRCSCPSSCPHSFLSTNPPGMRNPSPYGYKQCYR